MHTKEKRPKSASIRACALVLAVLLSFQTLTLPAIALEPLDVSGVVNDALNATDGGSADSDTSEACDPSDHEARAH